MPKTRAVLFDLDGTLLDTIEDLAACMNAAVQKAGLPAHPVSAHKQMVGDGVANYVLRALPEDRRGDKDLIQRVRSEYGGLYRSHWADFTRPYDGIEEMLDALAGQGLALAVLSNKPDNFTGEMVRHYFPAVPFAAVKGAVEGSPLKPDPAAALAIAGQLQLAPDTFIYLGDTATDMRTAVAAGMLAVGVLWGFRDRQELQEAGAQRIIAKPEEVLTLLQ
jgi:phosphoglycolate phosphatase